MRLRRLVILLVVLGVATSLLSAYVLRLEVTALRNRLAALDVGVSFESLRPSSHGMSYVDAIFHRRGLLFDVYLIAPDAEVGSRNGSLSVIASQAEFHVFSSTYSVPSGVVRRVDVRFRSDRIDFEGNLLAPRFFIDTPFLFDHPVKWRNLEFDFSGHVDRATSIVTLDRGTLRAGGSSVECSGTWSDAAPHPFDFTIKSDGIRGEDLPHFMPRALILRLDDATFGGNLSFSIHTFTDATQAVHVASDLRSRLTVAHLPDRFDTSSFRTSFTWEVMDASGGGVRHDSGPASTTWVPLTAMAPAVSNVLVAAIDPLFWTHSGISSLFTRGLPQRLAANLWSTFGSGIARELDLAVLATRLDQEFNKQEILALYLNTAPAGNQLVGIRDASRFYFDTTPDRLTIGQAVVLAIAFEHPQAGLRSAYIPDGQRMLQDLRAGGVIDEQQRQDAMSDLPRYLTLTPSSE